MAGDARKKQAQRLVMLSMKYLQLAYQDQIKNSGGQMALLVAGAAIDGFLEEIENAPSARLTPRETEAQNRQMQQVLEEMKALSGAS